MRALKRLVVGMDGSKHSRRAFEWAARLAKDADADLIGLAAFTPRQAEVPPLHLTKMRSELGDALAQWCNPIADRYGVEARLEIVDGDPRGSLVGAAEQLGASALVIGALGSGGSKPGPLHLGSVTEHIAHFATVPLAVIAPDSRPKIRRILLCLDGSPHSLAAAEWCASVARGAGAPVTAVTVREPVIEWTRSDSAKNWRRWVEASIEEEWATPLLDAGVEVTPLAVRKLSPVDGIIDAAEQSQADLVVLGTRGAGGFLGLRVGGTALKVLHRLDTSVVLVPR
jgi:nucleotide-binding universal stress UspA family protein